MREPVGRKAAEVSRLAIRNAQLHKMDGNLHRLPAGVDYGMLTELFGFWVRRAGIRSLQSFQQNLAEFDVSPTQAAALILIEANPGLSQVALAGALSADPSTVVSLLNGFEARGLIVRTRLVTDRRHQVLSLSRLGEKTVKEIKVTLHRHNEYVLENLSKDERRNIMALLRKFVET